MLCFFSLVVSQMHHSGGFQRKYKGMVVCEVHWKAGTGCLKCPTKPFTQQSYPVAINNHWGEKKGDPTALKGLQCSKLLIWIPVTNMVDLSCTKSALKGHGRFSTCPWQLSRTVWKMTYLSPSCSCRHWDSFISKQPDGCFLTSIYWKKSPCPESCFGQMPFLPCLADTSIFVPSESTSKRFWHHSCQNSGYKL